MRVGDPPPVAAPPLTRVYVEPTTRCNLRCRTCMRNTWAEEGGEMSMGTFDRLAEDLRRIPSLETVAFWGIGEPLLHPSLVTMIRRAKELGTQTELITNGLLLDGPASRELVDAGLDTLVVSLDGVSQAAHRDIRPGADFETVRDNLRNLQSIQRELSRANPGLGIAFVVMRRNRSELPKLPALAEEVGARFVLVTNLLPHSRELADEILYWRASGAVLARGASRPWSGVILPPMDAGPKHLPHPEVPGARAYGIRQDWTPSTGVSGHCPFVETGSLAIAWDGAASPCVPLMHSHSCFVLGREKRLRRYALGNVREDSIGEIWEGREHRAFQRRVLAFDFPPCIGCGGCDLVESNDEDCFGNPHPTCGDCLWSRGIVVCP